MDLCEFETDCAVFNIQLGVNCSFEVPQLTNLTRAVMPCYSEESTWSYPRGVCEPNFNYVLGDPRCFIPDGSVCLGVVPPCDPANPPFISLRKGVPKVSKVLLGGPRFSVTSATQVGLVLHLTLAANDPCFEYPEYVFQLGRIRLTEVGYTTEYISPPLAIAYLFRLGPGTFCGAFNCVEEFSFLLTNPYDSVATAMALYTSVLPFVVLAVLSLVVDLVVRRCTPETKDDTYKA